MAGKKEKEDDGKEIFDDKLDKARLNIYEGPQGFSFFVDYDNGTRTEKGGKYKSLLHCMSRAIIQRQKMLRTG